MSIYVAMLRGINVGGNKIVKMDRLRALFGSLGFERVQTYIQSGNIVFKAGKGSPTTLSKKIEEGIMKDFGFPAALIVRTSQEIADTISRNPYAKEPVIEIERLHVMFLREPPTPETLEELARLTTKPDRSLCSGKEIYFHLPNGVARSSLANNPIERRYLSQATMRNWKTVNTLHQMCQSCA
jgi:uncharacterized protein (DUF1697 family)